MNPLGGDGSGDGNIERRGTGRGRGRGLCTSTAQEYRTLRKPHCDISGIQTTGPMGSKNTEQSKLDKSFDDIIQNSTLSVDAAEFIPKSFSPKQSLQQQQPSTMRNLQKHSVQDRIQRAREIPLQAQNYHQDSSGDEDNYLIEFANTIQNLMSVIHSLILNPGCFTVIVPPLIHNIRPYLDSPFQLEDIIQIIIQQSINEGNFRYSGARLCCALLDTNLTSVQQELFKEILYAWCRIETDNLSANWKQKDEHTEEEQERCHGLILFLAELVTQMEHTSAFGLGDLLISLICTVLKRPAPNSVKNICQALKLAGQTLEKDGGEMREEMDNMMRALTEFVTSGRVDTHIERMVYSVRELRNGNWGQTSALNSTIVESTETIDPNQALDEPVLYGPDGKVLTAEENKFLEDVSHSTIIEDHVISEHDYEDEKWSSEDEDNVDAAYEEFLKHIPKQINKQ
ncbi:polyadenylate-binding protein-interacting protein 1 isoform X2 [Megachile rotundata]|uniref:polyadenylate-binding protein-interacting protein 1 isoform X2 n=1 Tax=Megachile rotundata TaxID=143995 RepID=UPI0006151F79|nr:PREDICTED: uncharacterized protein LOC100879822 isoform X2 [Megachile rotundata]